MRRRGENRGSRYEPLVVALLLAAAGAAVAFMVLYVAFPDTQLLGLAIGLALALLAAAAGVASKRLVAQERAVDAYHEFGDPEGRRAVEETVTAGGDGISRRRLLAGAAGAAGVTLAGAAVFPVASLGPRLDSLLAATPWRAGRRVVDADDRVLRVDDVDVGSFVTGFPQGAEKSDFGAPLIIVRLAPDENELPPDRAAVAPQGVIAFSKICPHAGCAVSMYRHPLFEPTAPSPALVCPCHYSTFDPRTGGTLEFGPAGRDLPQLPLRVNEADELEAAGTFIGQVGPSYSGVREPAESES